jgi:L-ascorbate metabolism protein UlaG (beta-lactamase superfamily)
MMVEIRYLGVAGWQISADGYSLVLDPYFTRISMLQSVIGRAIPNRALIRKHMPPADAILVTHAHYDHLMDVPDAAQITGAQVWASPQSCDLLRILGTPDACVMRPNDTLTLGPFTVEVHESKHRIVFGTIPYYGALKPNLRPPLRASDYRMDMQYSFRISTRSTRILVTSGIDDEPLVRANVLLVGADANRTQLIPILDAAQASLIMPNHWDDMFRPLAKPVRTMNNPPPTRIPTFTRIDLDAWAALVRDLARDARVIIPKYFEAISV